MRDNRARDGLGQQNRVRLAGAGVDGFHGCPAHEAADLRRSEAVGFGSPSGRQKGFSPIHLAILPNLPNQLGKGLDRQAAMAEGQSGAGEAEQPGRSAICSTSSASC